MENNADHSVTTLTYSIINFLFEFTFELYIITVEVGVLYRHN